MRCTSFLNPVIVAGALVSVLGADTAWAQTFTPIDQLRRIAASAFTEHCGGSDSDERIATETGPFDFVVHASFGCALAGSEASVIQQSVIPPVAGSSMWANGTSTAFSGAGIPNEMTAQGISDFNVMFELPLISRFRLDGEIRAMAGGHLDRVTSTSFVHLQGPGDLPVLFVSVTPEPDGTERIVAFDGVGVIQPGVYQLLAQSLADIDNPQNPYLGDGTASFQLLFEISCAADFNDDGETNTLDILAFLNAWGAADPRADYNSDGVVNTLDVIVFLNVWTAGCP